MGEPRNVEEDIVWRELVRTNNAVLVSAVQALLDGADIPHVVLDQYMSVLEGSLGILPRRILVDECGIADARQLLEEAGLGHELRPDGRVGVHSQDAVLGGRLLFKQPRAATVSAMMRSCWRRHARRARATRSWISVRAWARPAWRSRARRGRHRSTLVEIDPVWPRWRRRIRAERTCRRGCVRSCWMSPRRRRAFAAAGLAAESATRVLINPPFNDPARQRASPDRGGGWLMPVRTGRWPRGSGRRARLLRPRGTLTLIWRADGLAEVLNALEAAFGAVTVLPVHAKAGERRRSGFWCVRRRPAATPLALLPGLVLTDAPAPHGRGGSRAARGRRTAAGQTDDAEVRLPTDAMSAAVRRRAPTQR